MVRNPPTSGPNATDAPATVPHAANAIARSGPSNVVDRIDSVAGIISDAPMPSMIASPSTSIGTECETDASSEPTPKIAAPTMNMRRWPYMSPSRPPMISSVANVSEYPVITHCRLGQVGVELAQDRRNRDVQNGVVEHRNGDRNDHDRGGQPPPGIGSGTAFDRR